MKRTYKIEKTTRKAYSVAVTGAAGQIGSHIISQIASGTLLGEREVELRLIDIPQMEDTLIGLGMELIDMNQKNLVKVSVHTEYEKALEDVDAAILIGGRPQKPGEPRSALLASNAEIVVNQARAVKNPNAEIVVTVNPANTLALAASKVTRARVTSLSRLDENRANSMMRDRYGEGNYPEVYAMGDHGPTMYLHNLDAHLVYEVKNRAAAVQKLRGRSSSFSAAKATVDHLRDLINGVNTPVSMGMVSKGEYGVEEGLVFAFPARIDRHGNVEVVEGLNVNEEAMRETEAALKEQAEELESLGF